MTRAVFADTSGWLAVVVARERRHAAAVAAYGRLLRDGVQIVTTNLVVAEMHALVVRERGSEAGAQLLDRLYGDPSHEVRFVDRELEASATDRWLRPFRDHAFSLTDAVSFEVMRREGIRTALALDRHFAVAGFELVPGEAPVRRGKR